MSQVKVAVATFLVSLMLCGSFVVFYTTQSNQKWCNTLEILTRVDPHDSPQATTPFGKRQRQSQIDSYNAIKKQMDDFHCRGGN